MSKEDHPPGAAEHEDPKRNDAVNELFRRAKELQNGGLDWLQAMGRADLEKLIAQWPSGWGDDFQVLLYGDFDPPGADLEFEHLGIRVLHEPVETKVIRSAKTVLRARVTVAERSVNAILDATRRLNILLGAWTLVTWSNSAVGWWSHITHSHGGGVKESLDHEDLPTAVDGIGALPESVRPKVDAALFWVREPQRLMGEHHRPNLLGKYVAYWNAFECLVDAIAILQPQPKESQGVRQAKVTSFLQERGGALTLSEVEDCYRIVNPGFRAKASHALTVCFGDAAPRYIEECFTQADEDNRLYAIRNAINHGDVDAENPDEQLRIQSRIFRLWMIVWGMFGRLVPFPAPVDRPLADKDSDTE